MSIQSEPTGPDRPTDAPSGKVQPMPDRIWVEAGREMDDEGSHKIEALEVVAGPDATPDYPYQETAEYVRAAALAGTAAVAPGVPPGLDGRPEGAAVPGADPQPADEQRARGVRGRLPRRHDPECLPEGRRMKRTPLRPSLKGLGSSRSQPLRRGGRLQQTRHRKAFRHLRDEPYKAFVREQGCILKGRPGHICKGRVEFAHLDNEGLGHPDRGNGVGLCGLSGHREGAKSLHVMGKVSFPRYWKLDLPAIAAALLARYETEEEWT